MNNHQWKILLVEDDEDDFTLTSSFLQEAKGQDFQLQWVQNAETALKAMASERWDVILVDYHLGAPNGLELIQKAVGQGIRIPMILLTGQGNYEIDLQAMQAGAADYLAKSEVNAPLLERTIRYTIERSQTEEALRHAQDELEMRVKERTQELARVIEELRAEVGERLQAEQALQASQERLRTVVTGAPLILWAIDRQGTITLMEGKGLSILNISPGQYAGRSMFERIASRPDLQSYLERALSGEEVIAQEAAVEIPAEILETRYSPYYNEVGEVAGVIGVSTVITERVRAEAQLSYQAYLLENINDAIVATDEHLVFTGWNRTAEVIYGWKADEVIGRTDREILQTEWIGPSQEEVEAILAATGHYEGQCQQTCKNGQRIFVEQRTSVLWDENDQAAGYVTINRDVTDKRRMEAELAEVKRRLIDSTESERLHIAQELHDGAMQDLYALTYQLEGFRNTLPEDNQRQIIATIQGKLQEVIQALRVTAGELRPPTLAPFGLEKAIRSHAEQLQAAHPELNVRLQLASDRQTLPERVRLALFRIYQVGVANVLRHARASQVDVRFSLDDSEIRLEIEDNGCGFEMPPRWINFARQGHLGLVGASERAEAIGGKLIVKSAPGQGTLLQVIAPRSGNTIDLPLKRNDA